MRNNKEALYTIMDRKAEMASPPFTAVNESVAVRNYLISMKNVAPMFFNDFELLRVGTFDTKTATIKIEKTPVRINVPEPKQEA